MERVDFSHSYSLLKISIAVIVLHTAILSWGLFTFETKKVKRENSFRVETIQLNTQINTQMGSRKEANKSEKEPAGKVEDKIEKRAGSPAVSSLETKRLKVEKEAPPSKMKKSAPISPPAPATTQPKITPNKDSISSAKVKETSSAVKPTLKKEGKKKEGNKSAPQPSPLAKETPKEVRGPSEKEISSSEKSQALEKEREAEQRAANDALQSTLSRAKESLSKIGSGKKVGPENSEKKSVASAIELKPLTGLHIDGMNARGGEPGDYRDALALRLKSSLKLPEWGDVAVEMTVNRQGKVLRLKVLNSDNPANQKFVETALPRLTLPPFGTHFTNLSENTFIITLTSK